MMKHTYFPLYFLCCLISPIDASTTSWTIYHSWNSDQDFNRRGVLEFSEREEQLLSIKNDENLFSPESIKSMLNYGWYHLKIKSSVDDEFVLATVPACSVIRAGLNNNFKDQFDITFARSSHKNRQDHITSFAYIPLVSPLASKSCNFDDVDDESVKFSTSKVNVQLDKPAMIIKNVLQSSKPPPGILFKKQPRQREEQGDQAVDKNAPPEQIPSPFSFLQKYWYIILPMILLQFLQAPPSGDHQQQGYRSQADAERELITKENLASIQTARRGKRSA